MIGFNKNIIGYDGHDEPMTNFKRSSCVTHGDYDDLTNFFYIVKLKINKIYNIIMSLVVKALIRGERSSCSSYSVMRGYDEPALSLSLSVIKFIITVTGFKDWKRYGIGRATV